MKVTRGLEAGLIAAACTAPFFFGCVHEWASAGLAAFLFFLVLLYPEAFLEIRHFPFSLKAAGALFCLWAAAQFSFGFVRDAYSTGAELVLWLAFASGFLLVQRLDSRGVFLLAQTFIVIGLCEALYAVWQLSAGREEVLWQAKTQYFGYATGTYINRNHLAGLLELCLGVHLGAVLQAFKQKKMRLFVFLALSWMAVFGVFLKTGSRAGLLSFLAACGLVFIFRLLFLKKKTWVPAVMFTLLFSAAFFFWGRVALARFYHSKDIVWSMEGRFETWKAALVMIRDNPWGVGLGGFEAVFPHYQSSLSLKGWGHAHQDYLELLAQLGIPGFCVWAFLIVSILIQFMKTLAVSKDDFFGLEWGIFTALLSLGIHALMDFNLAIPANAFLSVLLLAAAFRLTEKQLRI